MRKFRRFLEFIGVLCATIVLLWSMYFAINTLAHAAGLIKQPGHTEVIVPDEELDDEKHSMDQSVETPNTFVETIIIEEEVELPPIKEEVTETDDVIEESVEELPYTDEELEMMALAIYQEAGSNDCSDETRMMVGNVIMNRVESELFPNTIYEVLTARGQYGRLHWTGIVWPESARYESEAPAVERAYDCAIRILSGERVLPSDVIWQAEFSQGVEIVAFSDGIYFCR